MARSASEKTIRELSRRLAKIGTFGLCLICGEPRTSYSEQVDGKWVMWLACSADLSHGPDTPPRPLSGDTE